MQKTEILERLRNDLIENKEYEVNLEYDKKGLSYIKIDRDC